MFIKSFKYEPETPACGQFLSKCPNSSQLKHRCIHLYVIDETVKANDNLSESPIEKHKFKVRDILINHIDNEYHPKVMDIKDPVVLLRVPFTPKLNFDLY